MNRHVSVGLVETNRVGVGNRIIPLSPLKRADSHLQSCDGNREVAEACNLS